MKRKLIISDIILTINVIGAALLIIFLIMTRSDKTAPGADPTVKGCATLTKDQEAKIYYTNGSSNENDWKQVKSRDFAIENPQYLIVENEYIRIAYEKHQDKMEQAGIHTWYLKNSCGKFMRITNAFYGDYTYYVDTVTNPPTSAKIVSVSPKKVIVDFYYDNHTVRDREGMPPESVGARPFVKRIEIDSGLPGAYLNFISPDPNPSGEREFGLGMGGHIYYGVADDWVWDLMTDPGTQKTPSSPYYLGFPDKGQYQEFYYSFLAAPEDVNDDMQISMYKFNSMWGGPVINRFQEKPASKGVFLGAVPYQGQFVQEAEFLYYENGRTVENSKGARNRTALSLETNGKINLFPKDTFSPGLYKIALRASGQDTTFEIHAKNEVFTMKKEKLMPDDYQTFFLKKEIEYDPKNNDQYYIIVKKGQIDIDNFYYAPQKSEQAVFPENLREKLDFVTND